MVHLDFTYMVLSRLIFVVFFHFMVLFFDSVFYQCYKFHASIVF